MEDHEDEYPSPSSSIVTDVPSSKRRRVVVSVEPTVAGEARCSCCCCCCFRTPLGGSTHDENGQFVVAVVVVLLLHVEHEDSCDTACSSARCKSFRAIMDALRCSCRCCWCCGRRPRRPWRGSSVVLVVIIMRETALSLSRRAAASPAGVGLCRRAVLSRGARIVVDNNKPFTIEPTGCLGRRCRPVVAATTGSSCCCCCCCC